jgi:predicted membrane chloride channel (bestrophin family)
VLSYWGINEVARDIETVFIDDPNDLPLMKIQYSFNEQVLAAAQAVLDEFDGHCEHDELDTATRQSFYNSPVKQ